MFNPPKLTDLKYKALLQQSLNRAFKESNGRLNDFSRGNPLYVLLSALAWSGTEILYYANKLADRLARVYLGYVTETESQDGRKATTIIKVTLTAPVTLQIPAGTKVKGNFNGFEVIFQTTQVLTFNGASVEGSVSAEALETGERYSIPVGVLDRLIQPLSFISSVTNTTVATGTDPKSESEFLELAVERIRTRSCISESDFIFFCRKALGEGSIISAIGNLSADRSKKELGAVHVFLMNPDFTLVSEDQIAQVQTYINKNHPPQLGTSLYFSPMEPLEIRVEMVAKIDNNIRFVDFSQSVYRELVKYLTNHKPGEMFDIQKFSSRLWLIPGIITFEPIKVNDAYVNISSEKYVKMVPQYASVTMINTNDETKEVLSGAGESLYQED